jgi:hypothetical protein
MEEYRNYLLDNHINDKEVERILTNLGYDDFVKLKKNQGFIKRNKIETGPFGYMGQSNIRPAVNRFEWKPDPFKKVTVNTIPNARAEAANREARARAEANARAAAAQRAANAKAKAEANAKQRKLDECVMLLESNGYNIMPPEVAANYAPLPEGGRRKQTKRKLRNRKRKTYRR